MRERIRTIICHRYILLIEKYRHEIHLNELLESVKCPINPFDEEFLRKLSRVEEEFEHFNSPKFADSITESTNQKYRELLQEIARKYIAVLPRDTFSDSIKYTALVLSWF